MLSCVCCLMWQVVQATMTPHGTTAERCESAQVDHHQTARSEGVGAHNMTTDINSSPTPERFVVSADYTGELDKQAITTRGVHTIGDENGTAPSRRHRLEVSRSSRGAFEGSPFCGPLSTPLPNMAGHQAFLLGRPGHAPLAGPPLPQRHRLHAEERRPGGGRLGARRPAC